jgi:probable F420-dependent oxidoreductase
MIQHHGRFLMRFGLSTPIVTLVNGAHEDWERTAGIPELTEIATMADRLGYNHLTCADHVAVPEGLERGDHFWDPLVTFSYLAARTSRIRFHPHVLVIGYHHPLTIMKQYGTLDLISGGRVILGFGVGGLQEEFKALNAEYDGRGARADDALHALRQGLSQRQVSYSGAYYDYGKLIVEPHTIQARVPIWIGGSSARALVRALEFGDGWVPLPVASAADFVTGGASELFHAAAKPTQFDFVVSLRGVDPSGQAMAVVRDLEEFQRLGVTVLNIRLTHSSLPHCLEQLEAFWELARPFQDATGNAGSAPFRPVDESRA